LTPAEISRWWRHSSNRKHPKTNRLLAQVMNRLIARMVQKALDKDMDAVKAYCEQYLAAGGSA
jgi:hypothetical protein